MVNGKSVVIVVLLAIAGGGFAAKRFLIDRPPAKVVRAMAETNPVRSTGGSAADDVAIFVHPSDATKSLILAGDKKKGLLVYDLQGTELDFAEVGPVRHVDLRTGVKLGNRELTLVAAANPDTHQVMLFELAAEKPYLRELPSGRFESDVQAQGLCLYRDPATAQCSLYLLGIERDPVREAKERLSRLKELALLGDNFEKPAPATPAAPKADVAADVPSAASGGPPAATGGDAPASPGASGANGSPAAPAVEPAADPAKPGDSASQEPEEPVAPAKKGKADKKSKKEKGETVANASKASKPSKAGKSDRPDKKDEAKKISKEQEELEKIAEGPKKKDRKTFAVQFRLSADESGAVTAVENRRFRLEGKSEGCVCDDESRTLFVCEQEKGVWKFNADGTKDGIEVGKLVCKVGFPNPLRPDVEGIALFSEPDGKGYLVVSSRGSEDFVVLERQTPHEYVGRFKVVGEGGVDAVEKNERLDVTSADVGGAFGEGLLVFHDDRNESPTGEKVNQNFKLVPWSAVKASLGQ